MTIFLSFSIKNHHTECCLYGGFNPDNEAGSWYVEPQTLTEVPNASRSAPPGPRDRGEGPDGKGKSPAENDPRCEDPDTHTRFRQVCRCVPASATARAVLALVHAAEGLTL